MQLQLENIWLCKTKDDVQATLRDLPPDLNTLYARCFSKVVSDIGLKSLRWVYSAPRPFKVAELCEFLAVDSQTGALQREPGIDKSVVIENCSNLIYINVNYEVVLVHHSLRRFLQTTTGSLGWDLKQEQLDLGWLCLKYLTGPDFTLAMEHRREKVSIPYDGRTFVQQVFDLPSILRPRSARPARTVTVSPQALGLVNNHARRPLHALAFARQSWLPLTKHIIIGDKHWKMFLGLALRPSEQFKFHPWECQIQSMQAHYGKLLGWSIAHSHWPLFETLSYATSPQPRGEIFDIPLPEYRNLLPIHLAARTRQEAVATDSARYTIIFKHILAQAEYLKDEQKYTALHHAAEVGNYWVVHYLLERGGRRKDWEDKDDHMRTALAVAALEGKHEVLGILLQSGANCEMTYWSKDCSETLERPLMGAVKNGHLLAVKALLEVGTTPASREQTRRADVHAMDSQSRTALHYAAEFPTKNSGAIAKLLLEYRSDHDGRDKSGRNALEIACTKGNVATAKELLLTYVSDPEKIWKFIKTALDDCEDTVIQTFIQAGGLKGVKRPTWNSTCCNQLELLALEDLKGYIHFLNDYGMDLNIVNRSGNTPLMCAVLADCIRLTKAMLSLESISRFTKDENGHTALDLAVGYRQSESVIELLFDESRDSEGLTQLSTVLLRKRVQKILHSQDWRVHLAPGLLNNAVDALSKHRFTPGEHVATMVCQVVENLQFFSTYVFYTAPHMAPHMVFTIGGRGVETERLVIEHMIDRLHNLDHLRPVWERPDRYCDLHETSESLHYNAGMLFKNAKVTICLVPEKVHLPS